MTRILFTIPNFDTAGSGRALLKLATRLDRSSFEPHICCMHDRGEFFQQVKASGVPVHLLQYTTPMRPVLSGLYSAWKVSRFFRGFHLIHSFHYSDDYSEPLAARMAGTKWIYVKKNMSWGSRAWRLRTRLADGVVAQNTDMMRGFFGAQKKVRLIPIGVDTDEFRPAPPAVALMSQLGLPRDALVVLTVANLIPLKGIEYLIQAFGEVVRRQPTAWLVVVGDDRGPHGVELKRLAASLSCAPRILFAGKRSNVPEFQSIATIFVLPSVGAGEGGPISVLEAMASGTLALASDVAGIRDQLIHSPEQLFEPANAAALASRLDWALRLSPSEIATLRERQTRVVNERYSLAGSVAQHEAFYREVGA